MSRPKSFRRRFLINPSFQLAFIGRMISVAVAIIAVFYGANAYFFWNLRDQAVNQNVPLDHIFFRYLDYHEQRITTMVLALGVVVILGLAVFGLLYSHRIAGPLYRLTKHLRAIADNQAEPARVAFRRGDYFQEIASAYNDQLEARENKAKNRSDVPKESVKGAS